MKNLTVLRQSFGALVIGLCLSFPVLALELGEAKTGGLVGESATGYLGAVKTSTAVDALVADINRQRKARYQQIAKKNGISLEAVEVRAGQKTIKMTPAGEFVNQGAGWKKK
jgi:uncharacterized protein YdbL (DUF1318 family)